MENFTMISSNQSFAEEKYANPDLFDSERHSEPDLFLADEKRSDLFGMTEDAYCSLMHASQLGGFVVPGLNIVAPIGLWLYGKDKSETVRRHGLHIFNWMITSCLLFFFTFALCLFLIGFLFLPFLFLACLIFPILGTVKAGKGKEWVYPLSHDFFEV